MLFYGVEDIMAILGIKKAKAYSIISKLRHDLTEEGYIAPPAGRIQKKYFCERYNLSIKDCEKYLHEVA